MDSQQPGSKQKNYALIFAVAVVIMFAGSTVALLFYAESQPEQPSPDNANPNQPQVQGLSFESKEFDSKVIEVLPEIIIVGDTEETSIGKISSEFAAVTGVKALKESTYVGTEGGKLSYRAVLSLSANASPEKVFQEIQAKSTKLSSIQGIGEALVELPSMLTVSNTDLNIDKNYSPKARIALAFVTIGAQKNDLLKAVLRVTLANEQSSNQQVFESKNTSAEPQGTLETVSAKVASMEKKLFVQGSMDYYNFIDENALKKSLAFEEFSIESMTVQSLGKSIITATVSGIASSLDLNSVKDKLDSAELPDLNSFTLGNGSGSFTINAVFNEKADLNALEKGISNSLKELSINESQIQFLEPQAQFLIDLNLNAENSKKAFDFLQGFFQPKKIDFKAYQPLKTDLNSAFLKDFNTQFPIDSNSLQVFAKPGHSIGEEISFGLQVQVLRGTIIQAQGMEE